MSSSDRLARAVLSTLEPGTPRVLRAVAEHGAEVVLARLRAGDPALDRDGRVRRLLGDTDGPTVVAAARAQGIGLLVPGDPDWPDVLDDLSGIVRDGRGEVPAALWVRGSAATSVLQRSAALVGSRAATAYGVGVAADWAAALAERDVAVVSGAAYGIDAAAHRGALAVGGVTVAVLANGLDQPYPRGNTALLDRVAEQGLLVSEAAPGAGVTRSRFLSRNRLIAALSRGTVVVEAGRRSGALSTASWAEALLRPVAAVPGPVTSALSVGSLRLVRNQSAVLVASPDDVVELVGAYGRDLAPPLPPAPARSTDGLPEPMLTVREAMPSRQVVSVAEIVSATGLGVPSVLAALADLARRGLVTGEGDTWSLRSPRRAGA